MNLKTAVQRLFAPARRPAGRIGAEVELVTLTDGVRPEPVDPVVVAAGFDDAFVRTARPSFEPGGQLELNPPPQRSPAWLVAELDRLIQWAVAVAALRGVRLESVGTNPYHSCSEVPLRTTQPRYRATQELFDSVGLDGRRMMRLTASLQIAVDLLPGRAGYEQWMVANLAGPPLTAAFANSPWLDGQPAGIAGARTRIWQGVDLRRTGYDGRHLDRADPIGAYTAFAAAAERLPIPEARSASYHLSALFPPVRPRGGYLAVRYLDAQPLGRIGEAITAVATLLGDVTARRAALDLLLPKMADFEQAWAEAADGFSPDSSALLSIVKAAQSTRDSTLSWDGAA